MALATRSRQSERRERRASTRDRLLTAALELIAQGQSFGEISVDRLSSAAGTTRTTFYVYFESKSDLLLAWLEQASADVEGAAADWWGLDAAPTREQLRELIDHLLARYEPHAATLGAAYDASLFDERVRDAFRTTLSREIDSFSDHIERGQGGGWIDPGLAPRKAATWLTWMIQRGQHTNTARDESDRARLAAAYTDILWNALYAPAR
jgi:TetR/AcrR family transcriptional regulator, ethionamide resistance regulator